MPPSATISAAIDDLSRWLDANGPAGSDPYDVLNSPLARPAALLGRWGRIAFLQGVLRAPVDLRPWLGIPPSVNPKALGLLASARLDLLATRGDERFRRGAVECLDWLERRAERLDGRLGWGYPFDWAARAFFVPRGTPSVVVSAVAADAFLDAGAALGEPRHLEIARAAARFVLVDLRRSESREGLCFSYTPLDRSRILNASLLGAGLLVRTAGAQAGERSRDDTEQLRTARDAVAFVLHHQRRDGSWPYGLAPHHGWTDGYHTGFVLRSLAAILNATGWNEIDSPLDRGLRFYTERLIAPDGRPLHRLDAPWPADIHAAAEAILVLSDPLLRGRAPGLLDLGLRTADWTLDRLRRPDGAFGFRVHRRRVDWTPHLRWGQAWMLRALARLERALAAE